MGKKKQAQRTKNNVVPASSGRSAELLQSTAGVPFAGFTTLKQGGFIPILPGISDELDCNINEDFRLVWKKMNKKDSTTKLKALDEFKKLCQESDVDTLKSVLPYWPRMFCTLSTDEEHRVREAAHAAHRALVAKAGRNIAPFLKQLMGPWFTGQHDTYPPAASTAESSFQETFPLNKLVEAIVFCQEEILNYISNNLLNQTPKSLTNNQNLSQEVKEARYQRVVVCCLNGYALYLQRLPTEHLRKAEEANCKLVTSSKFWKFSKDPASIVRAAWFTALAALCEKAPFLLTNEAKHLCTTVFSNLDDTDPAVVRSVWQAALLSFSVVEDVWQHVSMEKLVLPKVWKVLREGADGNASIIYPNLLPLLSKIPTTLLPDKLKFYSKFFENLRTGLKVRNIQLSAKETNALITAFLECLRHLINLNCDDEKLCLSLLEEQVFPLIESVMLDSKLQLSRTCLFCGMVNLVNQWSKQSYAFPPTSSIYGSLTAIFWSKLTSICQGSLANHVTDVTTLNSNCTALNMLLTAMKNPESQSRKSLRVKFTSPKSKDDEEEDLSPSIEQIPLTALYIEERTKFLFGQLRLSFKLLRSCSDRARVVLVSHFVHIVDLYKSPEMFSYILSIDQLTWAQFYRQELACWLRDENIPLDCSIRAIFNLLEFVDNEIEVQNVFSDLSGEEVLAVTTPEGESQVEPLYVRWQEVLEWALRPEHQTTYVSQWIKSHGGVCRLASLLCRDDPSYNILHNCLRNLRQNSWLTTDSLTGLVKNLRHNLTDSSISSEMKTCSADLLHAMLQNTANHRCLAQLPTEDLSMMLYELFTANLQKLPHFPPCWQHSLAVLALKTDTNLTFAAICECCVDLMVSVIRTTPMGLTESQQLVSVLENLIQSYTEETTSSMLSIVLGRLSARLRQNTEAAWSLFSLTETIQGYFSGTSLPYRHFISHTPKDPLSAAPLSQYVTSMIPFVMMVVKLQTAEVVDTDEDTNGQFPYAKIRADLPKSDLSDWIVQVLQLQSICTSFKNHFSSTKQYFMLKEKITFILEECGLLSQLKIKEIVGFLGLSKSVTVDLLQSDPLIRLQKEAVIRDLDIIYNIQAIRNCLLPLKDKNTLFRYNYFPAEVLEEITARETLEKEWMPIINICCKRLVHLRTKDNFPECNYINIQDRVFDQFVAEQKEDRSLLDLPDEELTHIADVVDFVYHTLTYDSNHMKDSSWDACLVAAAALTLSLNTTLTEWRKRLSTVNTTLTECSKRPSSASTCTQPWPLILIAEDTSASEEVQENRLRLQLVRLLCGVCHLFDIVTMHMKATFIENRSHTTRQAEWADVFLGNTHTAMAQAWRTLAELPCDCPATLLLLERLSFAVGQCVVYPHFVTGQNTLECLDTLCTLLQSSETAVQLTAYQLLIKLIPGMLELDMKECEKDNVALSCQHVDKTLVYTQSIIDTILSGLSFGDTCIVEPFTDSYTYMRCYLLLWCSLLELCKHACSQLRALYTTWLKEEYLPMFLKTVFCLMPETVLHGEVVNQRIAPHFFKVPVLEEGLWGSDRLAELSCWAYTCVLRRLPAAVRQWWHEADHRVYGLVEHVTASYVSSELCVEEMATIQDQEKKFENLLVYLHPTAKEVNAVYMVEDCRMELVIELAHNHPLGLVKVRSGQRMVSTAQTRQWLLQVTIFLTHQNGSLGNALELWKTSLDKRFEGVEECYICFSILHNISHQLPKLSCQTCRKKFHSHCLYKWFTTSNKSTCPICRNLF